MVQTLPLIIFLLLSTPASLAVSLPSRTLEPAGDEARIQPGAKITAPFGCTLGWILRGGPSYYAATAGHCATGVGQIINVAGIGPIGAVVVRSTGGPGSDYAIVRVDPALEPLVDPTLKRWGGPTSSGDVVMLDAATLLVYGHGSLYGDQEPTRARVGQALYKDEAAHALYYLGFAQGGDSGMPIMTKEGRAVAIHTWSEISLAGIRVDPSRKAGTLVSHIETAGGQALGVELKVMLSSQPVRLP